MLDRFALLGPIRRFERAYVEHGLLETGPLLLLHVVELIGLVDVVTVQVNLRLIWLGLVHKLVPTNFAYL